MKTTIKYLFVFGFASILFLGCATQPAPEAGQNVKYDYHTEFLRQTDGQTTRRLNELNAQGWVIVSVTPKEGASIYTFRRPKQ